MQQEPSTWWAINVFNISANVVMIKLDPCWGAFNEHSPQFATVHFIAFQALEKISLWVRFSSTLHKQKKRNTGYCKHDSTVSKKLTNTIINFPANKDIHTH